MKIRQYIVMSLVLAGAITTRTYAVEIRDMDFHNNVAMKIFREKLDAQDFGFAKRWLEDYFRELTLLKADQRFAIKADYNPALDSTTKDQLLQIYVNDWKEAVIDLFLAAQGAGDVSQDWYMEMGKTLKNNFDIDLGPARNVLIDDEFTKWALMPQKDIGTDKRALENFMRALALAISGNGYIVDKPEDIHRYAKDAADRFWVIYRQRSSNNQELLSINWYKAMKKSFMDNFTIDLDNYLF